MKVARGLVHTYLGINLVFTTPKIVKVTMLYYVDEIIESWDKACSELDDRNKVVSSRKRMLLQYLTIYSGWMKML